MPDNDKIDYSAFDTPKTTSKEPDIDYSAFNDGEKKNTGSSDGLNGSPNGESNRQSLGESRSPYAPLQLPARPDWAIQKQQAIQDQSKQAIFDKHPEVYSNPDNRAIFEGAKGAINNEATGHQSMTDTTQDTAGSVLANPIGYVASQAGGQMDEGIKGVQEGLVKSQAAGLEGNYLEKAKADLHTLVSAGKGLMGVMNVVPAVAAFTAGQGIIEKFAPAATKLIMSPFSTGIEKVYGEGKVPEWAQDTGTTLDFVYNALLFHDLSKGISDGKPIAEKIKNGEDLTPTEQNKVEDVVGSFTPKEADHLQENIKVDASIKDKENKIESLKNDAINHPELADKLTPAIEILNDEHTSDLTAQHDNLNNNLHEAIDIKNKQDEIAKNEEIINQSDISDATKKVLQKNNEELQKQLPPEPKPDEIAKPKEPIKDEVNTPQAATGKDAEIVEPVNSNQNGKDETKAQRGQEGLLKPESGGGDEPALTKEGGNTVVDENGQPLTVYHGTDAEFIGDFDNSKLGGNEKSGGASKLGFFFSSDKTTGQGYGKNLKQVHIRLENPLVIDAEDQMYDDMRDEINDAAKKAKKDGNDGLIIKNLSDEKDWGVHHPSDHYLVFDPKQIKEIETKPSSPIQENDNLGNEKKNDNLNETPEAQKKQKLSKNKEYNDLKRLQELGVKIPELDNRIKEIESNNEKVAAKKTAESDYHKGKTALEMMHNEGFNSDDPNDVYDYVSRHSENPLEVAQNYLFAQSDIPKNDYKSQQINEYHVTLSDAEWNRFLDRNSLSQAQRAKYIDNNPHKLPFDSQLMELSDNAGVEIIPDDFVDHVQHEDIQKASPKEAPIRTKLKDRFYELTGYDLNNNYAKRILKNEAKRQSDNYERYINEEAASAAELEGQFYEAIKRGDIHLTGEEIGGDVERNAEGKDGEGGYDTPEDNHNLVEEPRPDYGNDAMMRLFKKSYPKDYEKAQAEIKQKQIIEAARGYEKHSVDGKIYTHANIGDYHAIPIEIGDNGDYREITEDLFNKARDLSNYENGKPYKGKEKQYEQVKNERRNRYENELEKDKTVSDFSGGAIQPRRRITSDLRDKYEKAQAKADAVIDKVVKVLGGGKENKFFTAGYDADQLGRDLKTLTGFLLKVGKTAEEIVKAVKDSPLWDKLTDDGKRAFNKEWNVEPEPIGISREIMKQEAIDHNMTDAERNYFQGGSDKKAWEDVNKRIQSNPDLYEQRKSEIIGDILKGEKPKVSDDDALIGLHEKVQLRVEHNKLLDDIYEAKKKGDNLTAADLEIKKEAVERKQADNMALLKTITSTGGKLLRSAGFLTGEDMSFAGLTHAIERLQGFKLSKEQSTLFKDISAKYEQAMKDLKDLRDKQNEADNQQAQKEKDLREKIEAEMVEKYKTTKQKQAAQRKPSLTAEENARKLQLRKEIASEFHDITDIPRALLSAKFREYTKLSFKESVGDFKNFSKDLIDAFGKGIKEHLPQLFKDAGGTDEQINASKKSDIDLNSEFKTLAEKTGIDSGGEFHEGLKSALEKMFKNRVESGETDYKKIINDITDALEKHIPDINKEQVRDLHSGYGDFAPLNKDATVRSIAEMKNQERLDAKLEATERNELPLRNGFERAEKTTETLKKEAKIAKNIKDKNLTPALTDTEIATQYRTKQQAYGRALDNEIAKLNDEINTGQKRTKANQSDFDKSQFAGKVAEKERLQKIRDSIFGDSDKAERTIKATENAIKDIQKDIDTLNDGRLPDGKNVSIKTVDGKKQFGFSKTKSEKVTNDRIKALESQKAALKSELDRLMPDAVKNKALIDKERTARQRRLDFLEKQVADKNFAPKPNPDPKPYDKATDEINLRIKKLENTVAYEKAKIEQKNRNWFAKTIQAASLLQRFNIFFDYMGIGRLTLAAMYRPVEQQLNTLSNLALSNLPVSKQVLEKSITHYTPNVKSALLQHKDYYAGLVAKETWDAAVSEYSKHSIWELIHSDKPHIKAFPDSKIASLLEKPQQTHGFLKSFPKMARLKTSYENALRNLSGMIDPKTGKPYDITDGNVRQSAMRMAEIDALTDVFMQDNVIARKIQDFIKTSSEDENAGVQVLALYLSQQMPVLKIPANFYAEQIHKIPLVGTIEAIVNITRSGEKGAKGDMRGGVRNLTQEQAARTAKLMTHQMVGAIYVGIGVALYKEYGDDLIDGIKKHHYWLHNPSVQMLTAGIKIAHDMKNGDKLLPSAKDEIWEGAKEGTKTLPQIRAMAETTWMLFNKASKLHPERNNTKLKEMIVRLFTPQGLANLAKTLDHEQKRDPQTFKELLEMRIPGLRESVPAKTQGTQSSKPSVSSDNTKTEKNVSKE